jgi:hypothetical protein
MVKTVLRWNGLALVAGAVFMGAGIVGVGFQAQNQIPTSLANTLLLVASILIILALPGIYVRQSEAAGWLGLLGHVLLEVGMLSAVTYAAAPLFYPEIKGPPGESISVGAYLLGTALLMGVVLTAIATLRAGVYSRWSAILLLAAGVGLCFVYFIADSLPPNAWQLGNVILGILFAAALAWIGVATWTDWTQPAPRHAVTERP